MQTSEPGLRERKRLETRVRLETAAVALVLKNGIEHATLDAICEAADVSTRTFFNYFDSKEDAILGLQESEITEEIVAQVFDAHPDADAVELAVRLMFRVLNPSVASSKLFTSRMKIVRAHPQLLGRMANQMQRMGERLSAAIQPVLRNAPGFANEDLADLTLTADVLLALCGGAARAAVKEWALQGNQTPLEAVEERAIVLVRNTVERIK